MKKAFSILMLLVAMLMAWPARAQVQLTVANGTTTNEYVPIYGYYADAYLRAQMIYPGTSLGAMTGGVINSMTFYAQSSANWGSVTFQVKVGTTSATTLSGWSTETLTTVYTGVPSLNNSNQMVINFTTPFVYTGGNLLVEFASTSTASYANSYWYGISSTGSSVQGYDYDDASSIEADQQNFLPKVTFNYAPASQSCPMPFGLTASNITYTSADITWRDTANAGAYRLFWAPADTLSLLDSVDVYDTSYSFYSLYEGESYVVRVKSLCSGDESYLTSITFSTNAHILYYNMTASFDSIRTCNAYIYDNGGPSGNYANSSNNTLVVRSNSTDSALVLSGTFTGENGWDYLSIYEGVGTTGTRLFYNSGTNINIEPLIADAGAFTIVFTSDGSGTYAGYELHVQCFSNTCPRPTNFHALAISSDEVTLGWTPGGNEYQWVIDTNGVIEDFYDTTATFTGLTPNTDYTFTLRGVCGADDSSLAVTLTLHTPCTALDSLPYTQDFEAAPAGGSQSSTFVDCMTRLNNGTSYYGYPYVSSSSTYNHTSGGGKGLYWYNSTTTGSYGDYQVVVLPGVDTDMYPINTLQLNFWAKASSTSYSPVFQVGVMTNPNDINTFQQVQTVNVGSSAQWQIFEIPLSNFTGSGNFVAIRANRPTSYWYAYVDDITLMEIPDCPHVANLRADSCNVDWISISWSEVGTATSWLIEYDTVPFTPGNNSNAVTDVAYDTSYLLQYLDTGYTYYIYVASECGGDVSPYESLITTTLAGVPATVPYLCDFEGPNSNGWEFSNGNQTNYWMVGTATNNGGSKSMYVTNNGTANAYSTGSTSFSYAYRTFNLSDTGEYAYSFDWKCNGESSWDYIRAWMAPATATFNAGQTPDGGTSSSSYTSSNPSGWIPLDGGSKLNVQSSWQTRSGEFQLTQPGTWTMVFMWANDASGGSTPPGAIDNISLGRNSCPPPTGLVVDSVDAYNITISWQPGGSEIEWYVSDGTNDNVSYDTSYTFTGLIPDHNYTLVVRAVCDFGDTSMFASTSAHTLPVCNQVENLSVTPGAAAAMVTWTINAADNATYSGATVEWKKTVDATWNTTTVTGMSAALSGLDPSTDYNLRVMANCSGDTSNWVNILFTTTGYPCAVVDPNSTASDTIGNGTTTNNYIPSYSFYNYGLSQQIYTATEISGAGNITSIAVKPSAISQQRTYEIYLAHTSQTALSGFIHPSDMVRVYDGAPLTLTANQWIVFNFDTPFNYNGTDNLLVCFRDMTGSYVSGNAWYVHSHSNNSVYSYQDGSAYDPFTQSGGTVTAYRNNIIITHEACAQLATCAAPPVVVENVGPHSVDLCWAAGGNEGSYSIYTKSENDTVFTYHGSTTLTNYQVTGLGAALHYDIKVYAICTDDSSATTVSVTTACAAVDLPYTENFENQSGTYSRNCWVVGTTNLGSNYPYPTVVNLTGDPNKLCLFWNGAYAIMPQMDAPLNQLQIRFRFVQGGDDVRFLMGLMDDPSAPISNIRVLDTIIRSQIDSSTAYINYTYRFDNLPDADSAAYIAFWDAFNDNYSFLDDIVVEYIPNCLPVTGVTASNATTSSVDLSWVDATATSYLVEYGLRGFAAGTGTVVPATGSPFTITGLTASTSYEAYVYAICGTDTSIASQEVYFNTACGPVMTLPYTMNFEGYVGAGSTATNILPTCWNTENTGAYIYYNTSTSQAPSQSYALQLMGNGIVVLPEMGVAVDSLMISFHNYNVSGYGLIVGMMDATVTSDYATNFVPVDTVYFGTNNESIVTAFLTSYTGTATRIALKAYGNSGTGVSHYIDNVVIDYAPSCPPVTRFRSTGSTSSTVTLAWTENGGATQWEFAVDSIATATPVVDSVVTSNPLVVTGLTGGTDYYFWVRPICGAGDTGAWAGPVHVVPGQWIMRANMTDTVRMCGGVIYDDGGPNGDYSVSQTSTIILMPDAPGNLISVSGTTEDESSYDYLIIYDGIGTSGTVLYTSNVSGSYSGSFTNLTSTNGPLTIYFHTDGSVTYPGFAINVSCIQTFCRVINLRLDATVPPSASQLALTWDDNGATYYEVEHGTPGFAPGTGIQQTTTTNSIIIPGLNGLTDYEIHVRSICGASDTGDWVSIICRTEMCDNAFVATTGSANGTSYYTPLNNYFRYTLTETIIDSAELAGAGDISAIAYSYAYATPMTDKTNCTIYFQPTNKSSFTSSSDIVLLDSTAVMVYTGSLNCNQGWNYFVLDTTYVWDGHSNLLVIVDDNSNDYNGSSYIFNTSSCSNYKTLVWYSDSYDADPTTSTYSGSKTYYQYRATMKLISCGVSSCARPTVTSTTGNYQSATMTWSGTGNAYEVAIKAVSDQNWGVEIPVNTNSYTFTGLQPATPYQLRVRQDCDTLGYSDWATTTFTTDSMPCLPPTNLAVSNLTNATGTFSWTPVGSETAWDLRVWNATFDTTYYHVTNPVTVGGYTAGVSYYAKVRALCGDSANIEGEWSDSIAFTAATCADVTGLTASDVTFNSVTVSWNAVPGAIGYRLVRRSGQLSDTIPSVTTNTYTFSGLESETPYVFSVQTICGSGWYSENFVTVTATTTASSGTTYTITAVPNNPAFGSVTGGGTYASGQTATLTATPATGYHFTNWGDGNTDNPRTVTVTGDATYTAIFVVNQYTVTVNNTTPTMGSVSGNGQYNHGETVTLTATANPNHHFVTWNDGDTHAVRTFVVTSDTVFTASFGVNRYTVTVNVNDAAMGSVSGGGEYDYNATATLTATENNGYYFIRWHDGNTANPRSLVVTGDITLTAIFSDTDTSVQSHTLTLSVNDPAMGSLSTYGGTYAEGTTVPVTATANVGYHFVNWSDQNTDNPRTFVMNSDITLTANFAQDIDSTAVLTVSVNGNGFVEINGVETTTYRGRLGDVVTLVATAYEGNAFAGWSDGVTEATRSYTLTQNSATLTANFNVGIADVATASCVLYPNPAKGVTTVSVTGISGKVRIAVLDLSGREVLGETVECSAECEKSLDIEGLAEGAYFVRITSEAGAPMVKKLIVR